jgi:S-adenosylmethionine:tRNA ribosyltransferase-isomerase
VGGQVEVLLLAVRGDLGPNFWEALVRPGRRIHEGGQLIFGEGQLRAEVLARTPSGGRLLRLEAPDDEVPRAIERLGSVPLPPYIHHPLTDIERYQTVYARQPGSAAAPTAGLHFTRELLAQLEEQGIGQAFVTLHIGLDTFRPIGEDDIKDHTMHSEEIEIDTETASRINAARAAGGRIVAVGTTAVRTLESVAEQVAAKQDTGVSIGIVEPYRGRTSLFLRPGSTFRAVDIMLTNFHLPKSTLIVLVSAFARRELILQAYEHAIAEGYRFYSFGDAMLII